MISERTEKSKNLKTVPIEPFAGSSGIDQNMNSSPKGRKSIQNAREKPKKPSRNPKKPNEEQLLEIYDPKRYAAEKRKSENKVVHKMSSVRHLQSYFESGQLKNIDNFRTKELQSSAKYSVDRNTSVVGGKDGVLSEKIESNDEKFVQNNDNKTHNKITNHSMMKSDAGPSTLMNNKAVESSLTLHSNEEVVRNKVSSAGKVRPTGSSNYLPLGTDISINMNTNTKPIGNTVKNSEIDQNINLSVSNRRSIENPKKRNTETLQRKHIDENRLSMYTPQRYGAQKTHATSNLLKKDKIQRNAIEKPLLKINDPTRYAKAKNLAVNKAANVDRTQSDETSTLLFKTRSIDMQSSVGKSNIKNLTRKIEQNVPNLYEKHKSYANVCPDDDKLRSLEKPTAEKTERTLKTGTVTEIVEWDSTHVSRRKESNHRKQSFHAVPSHQNANTSFMNRKRSLISIYSPNFVTKKQSKKNKKSMTSMMQTKKPSHDIDCRRILIRIVHENQEKTRSNKVNVVSE